MTLLFDIPEQKPVKTAKRCRDCDHIIRHAYSKTMFYCEIKKQKRTAYGLKKVKKPDDVCKQFEEKKP